MNNSIWISDLTHTTQGISAATFPLGASYVYSYAKEKVGKDFDFKLFKFPEDLSAELNKGLPKMLCFSNYSWNLELGYKFASIIKKADPNVVIVFGGPNFPTVENEMKDFLKEKSNIDFYIELEGELGFVDLIEKLAKYKFDKEKIKQDEVRIVNTSYLSKDKIIHGPVKRIKDVNTIPSPYLTGALDYFFDKPLIPMIETTRGCPFSCSFCSDGAMIKSLVTRYDTERVKEELEYIAKKVKNIDELIITDLNFAMYKQDLITADYIQDIQAKYNYPLLIGASAGKNLPKRTIEVAKKIKGWGIGGAIQSTDEEVLKSIKRSNISTDAYKELIAFGNTLEDGKTYTEVILGLPGDTKEKHYQSIRFGMDSDVNSVKMYQAMLLAGTHMSSNSDRDKFEIKTKFRTIPGALGIYEILTKKYPVAEIEEIIIAHKTLSTEDYLECRIMNLIVETFYNNAIFEEVFALLKALKISPMECIENVIKNRRNFDSKIKEIIKSFVFATTEDLYDTKKEANDIVLTEEIIKKYIGGDMGTNELLIHRALLFKEFDLTFNIIFDSAILTLKNNNKYTALVQEYVKELKEFIFLRKKGTIEKKEMKTKGKFCYDFEAIHDKGYFVDPNFLKKNKKPSNVNFFHGAEQRKFIDNQLKLYSTHAVGIGKMLQRTNLKMMFKKFKVSN